LKLLTFAFAGSKDNLVNNIENVIMPALQGEADLR